MFAILLLLTIVTQTLSTPIDDFVLHEQRSSPNSNTRKRVHEDAILPVHIALTQSNLENGYDYLLEISDPQSLNYGKHWTTEDVHTKFAPSHDTVSSVMAWLNDNGIGRENVASSASKGWLRFEASVKVAERLFSNRYYEETNDDGSIGIACDEYHLPRHLSHHIDYITPGVTASPPLKKIKARRALHSHALALDRRSVDKAPDVSPYDTSTCGQWITPTCLRALYGIPESTVNQPENAMGVFASYDTYDQKDIDLYFSHYAPWVPNGTHPKLKSINGAKAPVPTEEGGVEATLDFDLAHSLLYPQEVTLYQTQATETQLELYIEEYGPAANKSAVPVVFLPFVTAVDGQLCTDKERQSGADCGTTELTKVLSVSYGGSELQAPERAAKRICAEFMKLALKGHTLLLASQDQGVAQRPPFTKLPDVPWTNGCINPEHIESTAFNGTVFNPTFPASCPFVTAVGATQLSPDEMIDDPERVLNVHDPLLAPYPDIFTISSGGGVSNYFELPKYQKCAVDEYFLKHSPGYQTYKYDGKKTVGANGGLHAIGGRGIPDISANGAHMPQFLNGSYIGGQQAGTSLSVPIVGSMITLINQQRTLVGKGPVGFINPVIYQHPEAFTDIVRGTNPGCGTQGFPATEGWDPSTGLGTPIYPKLLEVFMNLP